ncbi:MAG: putative citrate synthase, partial [Microbacteriaceae bacterium]|nr:putative citrate synthase [Microbacteriaceae bacterium]
MTLLTRMDDTPIAVPRGMANVVVTDTTLGGVRGTEGFYHYRQYSATDLARTRSVEDVWQLLLDGALPTPGQRSAFASEVAAASTPSAAVRDALPAIAAAVSGLAGLLTALSIEGEGMAPLFDITPG